MAADDPDGAHKSKEEKEAEAAAWQRRALEIEDWPRRALALAVNVQ